MPRRKPELEGILKDLKQFMATSCHSEQGDGADTYDFVGDKCNDAAMILQEALAELDEVNAEDKK